MQDLLINLSIIDYLDAKTFFEWFVQNVSYIYVFVFMVVESSFVPFPSEVVVPPAVFFGVTLGTMNPILIVVVATLGALIGATINYYLALWLGRPIVYKFADSRLGHAMLLDREKVDKAEKYFDRHGAVATFIGRLIPAVRQLISIPAGLSRMNIGKFMLYTSLGALVWNTILAVLGYWLTTIVSAEGLFAAVEKYNSYLTIGGLALLGGCVVFIIYKALSAKRQPQE